MDSKLQTQVALSTMESEYTALCHSMRELIAVRGILKKNYDNVLSNTSNIDPKYGTIHKYGKFLNPKFMKIMKHVSNLLHFQRYLQGRIILIFRTISSEAK